jgi:tight adherence protein B
MISAMLIHPLIPSLFAFLSVGMAVYVIADFGGYISARYRERYIEEAKLELDDILIQMPAGRVLDLSLGLSAVALFASFLVVVSVGSRSAWSGGLLLGILMAALAFPLPRLMLRTLRKRRLKKFNEQLEDALMSISNSLKAGFSINQAIDEVAESGIAPVGVEFRLLSQEIRLGVPLVQALDNMNRRLGSDDFELVATAIITARQTGGELTATLERLAGLIRERVRIAGKLHAITAMGRLQALLIGAMPFLLLFGMYQVSPDLMTGLFDSFVGYVMVIAVVLLDIMGFLLIRKITTIDV